MTSTPANMTDAARHARPDGARGTRRAWVVLGVCALIAGCCGDIFAAGSRRDLLYSRKSRMDQIGEAVVTDPIVIGEDPFAPAGGLGNQGDLICPECGRLLAREPWDWWAIPEGIIYRSYLAGPKEPRFSAILFKEQTGGGWLLDAALGGRVGIWRFGNSSRHKPEGWQVDFEGAAFPRLDFNGNRLDVISTDYRAGVPLTYGEGDYQMKIAYYHLSAHLGDEFLLRTGTPRINYVRDAIVWGHSYDLLSDLRVYGEVGYSFRTDGGAEPWELQFGFEYAPRAPTSCWGSPFLAANALLQEEHDFGGSITLQVGWAWRNATGRIGRIGLHYLNGKSSQFEFFNQHEEQIGFALWYDF